jgi:hypothetical protein
MSEQNVAWLMMAIGTAQVALLVVALVTVLDDKGLPKPTPAPRKGGGGLAALFHPLRELGATIMTIVDEALRRLDAFVKAVLEQVKSVKGTNDTQTAKLAELQAALDAATSDDEADKAAIATLQAEVTTLQQSVADQINTVVDTLESVTVVPPAVVPSVVEEAPVVEAPVVEAPVVEEPVVEEPVVEEPVVDEAPVVEEVPVVDEVPVVEEAPPVDPVV